MLLDAREVGQRVTELPRRVGVEVGLAHRAQSRLDDDVVGR